MMMDIRPIRTEADHTWALKEAEKYFMNPPEIGTSDGDRFELLITLIEKYETEHYEIDLPDPIEAIKIRMEDLDIDRKSLCHKTGMTEGRLSEILNKRRGLSISMIRSFSHVLGLSIETLVQSYPLPETA